MKEKIDKEELVLEHCPTGQMWTDINTKPKQGAVYCEFRGHVMGIPADYNDKDYAGTVPSTPPVSLMLPVPKAMKASQECVGGAQILTVDRPSEQDDTGVEGRPDSSKHAPIKLVDGRPWSPGVYRALGHSDYWELP